MFLDKNKYNNSDEYSKVISLLKEIAIKGNVNYFNITDTLHRLNEIEAKLNMVIKNNSFDVGKEKDFKPKIFNNVAPIIKLENYNITYSTIYAGFLYLKCKECLLEIDGKSKIMVKEALEKYYLDAGTTIYIRKPIELTHVDFKKSIPIKEHR